MIELKHLRKEYPNVTPLKDVNAQINEGDVISVIGPSGTGKSTLLRCINLLERPTSGQILVDGTDITAPDCDINKIRQKMGMVFQSYNLFAHLTAIENIMRAPVSLLHLSRQEAADNAMQLLKLVGLADLYLKYPDQLSGGQKQRVAIARTLAMDPQIILLDEPTSALDPTMVGEVQAVVRDLARSGKTMMIVSHEMHFARSICNRVFYMDQGGIYEEGSPDVIFENPVREKTRQFVFRLKVLEIDVEGKNFDFAGAGTRIEQYCYKNQIPPRTSRRIYSVFEEYVMQILLPRLDQPKILVVVEYAGEEANPEVTLTARYTGPFIDPAAPENRLPYKIIQNADVKISHTSENENQIMKICFH